MKTKHSGLIMGPAAAPQAPVATKFWKMASTGDDEGEITLYGDVMSQQPVSTLADRRTARPAFLSRRRASWRIWRRIKDKGRITVKLNSSPAAISTPGSQSTTR